MDTQSAILAFSQSEKIKAGLIWASQTIEMVMGLPDQNKPGAQKIIAALISMVSNEIHLGMKIAPNEHWESSVKHINNAIVMLNSNVVHDAPFHLSKAFHIEHCELNHTYTLLCVYVSQTVVCQGGINNSG